MGARRGAFRGTHRPRLQGTRSGALAAKIDDTPGEIQPPRDPALVRNRFMKGRGHERSAVLDV